MSNRARVLTFSLPLLATLAVGGLVRAETITPPPRRNIGGPGDYLLRENLVRRLGNEQGLARSNLTVILVNGGVVFSGELPSWTLKRRALTVAAVMRGVVNVTDRLTISRSDLPDFALKKAVVTEFAPWTAELGLENLEVRLDDAVATLAGTVKDFKARVQAEAIAGNVVGVVSIINELRPANAPTGGDDDASIARALNEYLGDVQEYPYPAEIDIRVSNGVATLTGRVPYCQARRQAFTMASLVGGVEGVELEIKVDPSLQRQQPIVKVRQ